MTTETTALTVIQRAAVALGSSKAETELIALAMQSKSITAVTSPDGRTECHAAAMAAKTARIGVEKAGKAARDDATQFSKAVIAEEKRLVDLIAPEETRLITLRDAWDEKIAADKAAKAEAERLAIVAIVKRVDAIKSWPLLAADVTSESVLDEIEHLEAMEIGDSFKDYYGEATEAKAVSLQKLREIYSARVRAEAESIRIKQEREAEAEQLKAERKELAKQRADRDAEIKRLQLIRDEIAATQRLIAAESAKKAKAEEDQRAEQERIRKEAEAKAAQSETNTPPPAPRLPEPENAPVLAQQTACDSYSPVIQPNAEMIEPIFKIGNEPMDAMKKRLDSESEIIDQIQDFINDMRCNELSLVLHYCERLVSDRQPVAA